MPPLLFGPRNKLCVGIDDAPTKFPECRSLAFNPPSAQRDPAYAQKISRLPNRKEDRGGPAISEGCCVCADRPAIGPPSPVLHTATRDMAVSGANGFLFMLETHRERGAVAGEGLGRCRHPCCKL